MKPCFAQNSKYDSVNCTREAEVVLPDSAPAVPSDVAAFTSAEVLRAVCDEELARPVDSCNGVLIVVG